MHVRRFWLAILVAVLLIAAFWILVSPRIGEPVAP